MNLVDLKGLLATYKLERAGRKHDLVERLIEFSGSPNMWNRYVI